METLPRSAKMERAQLVIDVIRHARGSITLSYGRLCVRDITLSEELSVAIWQCKPEIMLTLARENDMRERRRHGHG